MVIENTGFNIQYWSRFNEPDFIAMGIKLRLFKQFPEASRIELLKQAYRIINDTTRTTKKANGV